MKRFLSLFLCVIILVCSVLPFYALANGNTTVYVTNTGECYHRSGCQYLRKSCISISLQDAVSEGYRACSKCCPPSLTYSSSDNSTYTGTVQVGSNDYSHLESVNEELQTKIAAYERVKNELVSERDNLKDKADKLQNIEYIMCAVLGLSLVAVIVLSVKLHNAKAKVIFTGSPVSNTSADGRCK